MSCIFTFCGPILFLGEDKFCMLATVLTHSHSDLTKWHIDNLLTHIAVLTLYIDDFETDTCDLREDLGLSQKTLEMYFKELGAKMAPMSEKQRSDIKITKEVAGLHRIAKLKLPLEFPKQRVVPLKGRR